MAWNYRKRIKIAPGVTINVSKGGVSTTVGKKGASVTFGKKGTYLNTGIPGTGMYNRQKISGPSSNRRKAGNIQTNNVQSNPVANQKVDTGNPGIFLILMLIFGILCVLFSIPLFQQDETEAGLLFVFAGIMSAMPLVRFYIIKSNNKTNAAQEETLSARNVEEPTTYVDEDICQEVQGTAIDEPVESTSKQDVINGPDVDPLFEKAAHFIVMRQQCSAVMLGAKFGIGFNRAERLID